MSHEVEQDGRQPAQEPTPPPAQPTEPEKPPRRRPPGRPGGTKRFRIGAREERVALLLAEGVAQEEVAAGSGISRSTIRRWLQEPEFQALVQRLRATFSEVRVTAHVDALKATHDELQDKSIHAARTLHELTQPNAPQPEAQEGWAKVPHHVRVAACKAILEAAQRLRQERLVEERLARLEQALGIQRELPALPGEGEGGA